MIYTLTINPSLDYIVRVEPFKIGAVNRTNYEEMLPGGKGINVSIVLNNLGVDSVALGFIAGFTGDFIEAKIRHQGCKSDFIKLREGVSRINVKLKAGEETEINGQGPPVSQTELGALNRKLDFLKQGDTLILAGSIPDCLPGNFYENIMQRLEGKDVRIVVDATKELLINVLKYRPFLIKPNLHELEELFQTSIQTREELLQYGERLKQMGACNVLVSLAGDGAVFLCENGGIYESKAPRGKLVNSVGAGDSMVAGFLCGLTEQHDYGYAFKMGIAAGSASAFSERLAVRSEVLELLKTI